MVREHIIAATVISLVGVLGVRQLRKDHAAAAPGADNSVAASGGGFMGRSRGGGEASNPLDALGNLLAGALPDSLTSNTPLAVTGSATGQAFNADAPTQAQAAAGVQGAAPTDTVVNDQVTQPSSPTSPLQSTRGTLAVTPISTPFAPAPAPSASSGADSLAPGTFATKLGFTAPAPAPAPVRNTSGTGGIHTKAV